MPKDFRKEQRVLARQATGQALGKIRIMAEKGGSWGQIKNQLKDFNRQQLLALLKDLHDFSPQNKNFLAARFAREDSTAALEGYRQRIIKCFPLKGFGLPKLREGRAAIRQYQKATSDLRGTIELMLTYVESGTEYTMTFGDIDEPFYDSLSSVLREFTKKITSVEGISHYSHFRERVLRLRRVVGRIGWGYGDDIRECIQECESAYEKRQDAHPASEDW
jgi:hypothetical protein